MKICRSVLQYIKEWLAILIQFLTLRFMSEADKDLEIIALRSQLALFNHQVETGKRQKPKANPVFRQLWVLLSRYYDDWKSTLFSFTPETVIRWNRTAFTSYWLKKSQKKGRPPIDPEIIALIKRIHKDNPLLSPEKIRERLVLLNVTDAPVPNTIAKYLNSTSRKPPLIYFVFLHIALLFTVFHLFSNSLPLVIYISVYLWKVMCVFH